MRRPRIWVAVFLLAAGVGGAWIVTASPDPSQTLEVEAPAPAPASTDSPSAPASMEELVRRALDSVGTQPLCDAPPLEMTEEMRRVVEEIMAKAPLPSTVPSASTEGVINIHRRLVPC